jgi:hypothetical protein
MKDVPKAIEAAWKIDSTRLIAAIASRNQSLEQLTATFAVAVFV